MPYDERQAALEIARLRRENGELREELARTREQLGEARRVIRTLEERIAELERASARQAAPFRREEKKKVPADQKKRPGRKPGHRGACRAIPDHIDYDVEVPLECCPCCSGQVSDRMPLLQYIEELPPVRPVVTRLVTWSGLCAKCGEVRSTHPLQTSTAQGAAGVQLGPRALAIGALLNKHLGLSMRKTAEVLKRLGGLQVTAGGLSQAICRIAERTAGEYDALLARIRSGPAVFADETSWWVDGPGWWLWTFTTPEATLYRVEDSRGSQIAAETLGDAFEGMLVSDCLNVYDALDCQKHKCIAHHQRAIAKARASPDTGATDYLQQWRGIFTAVCALYKAAPKMVEAVFIEERTRIENAIERLLAEPVTRPGEVAVQNRLAKQREHLVGCLYEPAAEPTNNRAERSLRPAVITRKISCGNRTERGKRAWEILASLAATCQQNHNDFVEWLAPRLALSVHAG